MNEIFIKDALAANVHPFELLKGRYRIALIIIFTLLTTTFGYFVIPSGSDDTRNYGKLLIIDLIITFALTKFLKLKLIFNFKFHLIFYFILFWMLIILFFREDIAQSGKNFSNILLTQFFLILVFNIFWNLPFEALIKSIIIYLQIVLLVCIAMHVKNGHPLGLGNHDEDVRLGGLFFFGITGVLAGLGAALSSFSYFDADTFKKKAIYLASFLSFALYTLACDMRTVLSAIMLSLFVQYFFRRISSRKSIIPVIFLGLMAYGMVSYYKSHSKGDSDVDRDLLIREAIWGVAKKLVSNQPIIGYGNYLDEIRKVSIADPMYNDYFIEEGLNDPHSSFFSLCLQSGLITFGLFVFLLLRIGIYTLQYPLFKKALVSLIFFWLVCGSTGGDFFDYTFTIRGIFFEVTLFGLLMHPDLLEYGFADEQTK